MKRTSQAIPFRRTCSRRSSTRFWRAESFASIDIAHRNARPDAKRHMSMDTLCIDFDAVVTVHPPIPQDGTARVAALFDRGFDAIANQTGTGPMRRTRW